MKTRTLAIFSAVLILLYSNCNKDDNNNNNSENWAASVAGTYSGTAIDYYNDTFPATTLISRVSDKLLDLQITTNGGYLCLDSVTMNSPTTIAVSEIDACLFGGNEPVTGSGNFNGNNVNFILNYTNTGIPVRYTINGTK